MSAHPSEGQRWIQLGVLALLIAAALAVLRPFVVSVAWAAILAYATWPVFRQVEGGLRGRTGWAAALMTVLVVVVVVGPAVIVSLTLVKETQQVFQDLRGWAATRELNVPEWVRQIPWVGPQVADRFEGLVADPAAMQRWLLAQAGPLSRRIAVTVGDVGRNLAGAGVALVTLFFLYRNGSTLLAQIRRVARQLAGERVHAMFVPLGETVRAVMYGMLLTALAQGALAMVGYWTAGLHAPALLGATTTLLAFVPFGAPMVYVPASAWLLLQGRLVAGVGLLLWGMVVVSSVDNVVRSWFISGATRVPFLLVFFAVLGGLAAFGSIGLFMGPIVISLLLVLWREWTESEPRPTARP